MDTLWFLVQIKRLHYCWIVFISSLYCTCSNVTDALAGGQSQGASMEASGRQRAEDGLYLPEQDCVSLHDSEGLLNVDVYDVWSL